MKYDIFNKVISTKSYKIKVKGKFKQNLKKWTNSNILLLSATYKYSGIKTGYIPT